MMKAQSTFFGSRVRDVIGKNLEGDGDARAEGARVVEHAGAWLGMSLEALWGTVFGPSIDRSWMVWSSGHCPACGKPVVMYRWKMKPFEKPWKVTCPECGEVFPKNDFGAYYRSGLGRDGVFDFSRADEGLLFNAEHPEVGDALRGFGVDDGRGYAEGEKRWRFIGAYLIYGQWKQVIVGGIKALAAGYVVTGDRAYSRRAAVLLDRVADVYPGFDYKRQGWTYEQQISAGYVSVWHDANREQLDLVIAYDQIFDAVEGDEELVGFLSQKAREYDVPRRKMSARDIHENIQERLLRDPLKNIAKVRSNFPALPSLIAVTRAVLGWEDPEERERIYAFCEDIVRRTTRVDGVTGEKGLTAYSQYTLMHLANGMSLFLLADEDFVARLMARVPSFARTYRFHIDTWCGDQRCYPNEGDAGYFGAGQAKYCGIGGFSKRPGVLPSGDRFLWEIYRATGDMDYLRILRKESGERPAVFDLTLSGSARVAGEVRGLVEKHGAQLALESVNFTQWHLAILRSGKPGNERALWLNYDSGGVHGHQDALNLGLIARGMELMPDAGYPAVQFGGWETEKGRWFNLTHAHNSVVVDGKSQSYHVGGPPIPGYSRLWSVNPTAKMVDARAPGVYGIKAYDRMVVLVDIDEEDFYAVDLFRVEGGKDHAKFMHSTFGEMTLAGVSPVAGGDADPGYSALLRAFAMDANAKPGWSADWKVRDVFKQLAGPLDLHLRYTDLTHGASAHVHEGWFIEGSPIGEIKEVWLPRLMVRRQGAEGLASTFVSVLEPYVGERKIASIRRVDGGMADDGTRDGAAIEVRLADGRRDVIHLGTRGVKYEGVSMGGEGGGVLRYDAAGRVVMASLMRCGHIHAAGLMVDGDGAADGVELAFDYRDCRAGGAGGVGAGGVKLKVRAQNLCDQYTVQRVEMDGEDLLGQMG
jgi:oligo-alginate lyase